MRHLNNAFQNIRYRRLGSLFRRACRGRGHDLRAFIIPMKAAFITLGLAAATIIGPITPALAQVVIHQDQSSDDYSAQDDTEQNFLHA